MCIEVCKVSLPNDVEQILLVGRKSGNVSKESLGHRQTLVA
jgi:hypothetical protein